ncbi:unnamed protein product [Bursaphelenchus okinawaensis]|uniref:Uncharacterized protein n=1 Tax=Bursaphelenchus okinawaensis TaxID=465554 RepID=A0A811KK89_9BILA|nr:unnamed protein product [Bursaphelenchus okinawaensis]CAG9106338.1 unnamed protein product [Bursaphelenchus okinawaensis]
MELTPPPSSDWLLSSFGLDNSSDTGSKGSSSEDQRSKSVDCSADKSNVNGTLSTAFGIKDDNKENIVKSVIVKKLKTMLYKKNKKTKRS